MAGQGTEKKACHKGTADTKKVKGVVRTIKLGKGKKL